MIGLTKELPENNEIYELYDSDNYIVSDSGINDYS